MMTKNADKKREQMQMFCMDDMVPKEDVYKRQGNLSYEYCEMQSARKQRPLSKRAGSLYPLFKI